MGEIENYKFPHEKLGVEKVQEPFIRQPDVSRNALSLSRKKDIGLLYVVVHAWVDDDSRICAKSSITLPWIVRFRSNFVQFYHGTACTLQMFKVKGQRSRSRDQSSRLQRSVRY